MSRFLFVLLILLLSAPAHADFRNQFGVLDTGFPANSPLSAAERLATYLAFANQWGYEWVIGDPWSGAKADAATDAGLKVMFNSNANKGAKWYNFRNDGTATVPEIHTLARINIGEGTYRTLNQSLWDEMEVRLCMTSQGVNMAYPDIWTQALGFKYFRYSTSSNTIIFQANYMSQAAVDGNVDSNLRILTFHQDQAGGQQIYHGLYMDETGFPGNGNPTCHNPGHSGSPSDYDPGRKDFIAAIKAEFAAAISGYGGESGNVSRFENYDPEHTENSGAYALDFYYSESSGGQECNTLAELEAGAATGCGSQNSATWGIVPTDRADVQIGGTHAPNDPGPFEASYRAAQLVAGRAAWQSIWFGWFGAIKLPDSNNGVQLLRVIPDWDNMVGATGRSWTESTDIYTSSNSYFDDNVAYSWHWQPSRRNHLFVVRHAGDQNITIPSGRTLTSVKTTDDYGIETGTCTGTTCFSQDGTTIINNATTVDKLYVLYFSSSPTVATPITITTADQVPVCWTVTDGLSMLPALDSTGWTVTVAAPPGGDVAKTVIDADRISPTCYLLEFAGSTITVGTQVVKVSYAPGNITDGSAVAATSFGPITATNTLPGGTTAAVQTQVTHQMRHFEGNETITADMMYGAEGGNMRSFAGGLLRSRHKIANTVAALDDASFPLYYDRNDSNFLPVTTSCSTSEIIYKDAPQIPTGTVTTEQLASTYSGMVACQIIETPGAAPVLDMAQNSETECEYALQICTDAATGVLRLRSYKHTGAPLDTYSDTPTITIFESLSERHDTSFTGGHWR